MLAGHLATISKRVPHETLRVQRKDCRGRRMSQGRVGGDTWRRQRIARYDDMFLKVTGGKGLVTCVILCRTGGASHFLTVSVKDSIILPD